MTNNYLRLFLLEKNAQSLMGLARLSQKSFIFIMINQKKRIEKLKQINFLFYSPRKHGRFPAFNHFIERAKTRA